jgi:hypothetical protein
MTISREINAIWVLALSQFSLGDIESGRGNRMLAEELSYDGLENFRQLGDKFFMARILSNLGYIIWEKGDFLAAKNTFLEALDLMKELGDKDGMTAVLNGLAGVFQKEENLFLSARLQGAVISVTEKELGSSISVLLMEGKMFDATAMALKQAMGEQAYQKEFETGMTLPLEEAVRLAIEGK